MKSTVEHLTPTRVKLTCEVDFDELKPQFDKAYKTLANQVNLPGFRKGKVPARVLDAKLGRGTVLTEVVNEAIPAKYGEAVEAEGIKVLGQPEFDISTLEDGDKIEFTAEVDVRPEIELPDMKTISVQVDDIEITDDEVEEQLEALRERFATTTTVDRAAADGDTVTVNLRATLDGKELEDGSADGLTYTVGSGELVEGVDEAIIGLSAGQTATFSSPLNTGEGAGRDAEISVEVTSVGERELPEVDEDFAQLASEFDTVAELRDDLVEKLRRVKNLQRGTEARDKILAQLLEQIEIPVPEGPKKAEIEARQHDAVHTFDHDEDKLQEHLESIGQTREELDSDIETSADEAVRTQLLLDALAESQGVQVSQQEFTERVMYNARRFGVSPDQYFQQLQQAGQLGSIFSDVSRAKALMGCVQQATITDLSDNVLDFETLYGIETVDDDETADSGEAAAAEQGDE